MEKQFILSTQLHVISVAVILAFISFYFLYSKLKRGATKRSTKKGLQVPEPAGAWPIIGHFLLLRAASDQPLHRRYASIADNCGPAFMIRLGTRRVFVINNSELARECFTTNDQVLAGRPNLASAKHMSYKRTTMGFVSYGPVWREMRKIAMTVLLSPQRIMMLEHIRVSELELSMKELYEKWQVENNIGKGDHPSYHVSINMTKWLDNLILNIVVRMIAGKKHYGNLDSREDDVSRKCRKAVTDILSLMGVFTVSDAFPMLGWLDLYGYERFMKRAIKNMDAIFSQWVEEHRLKKGSNDSSDSEEYDFIDVMLSSVLTNGNSEICGRDADTIIKSLCEAVVAGGSDTTLMSMIWAFSLLLNNRQSMEKAQAELDIKVGQHRKVEETDIKNLVYLQAIIKETLRLYPAVPLGLPHEAMEDCTIGGFDIPAGTCMFSNIWKIHRDPNLWTDPTEFRPERFLDTHSELNFRGQQFEYIPFGSGRRMCPGMTLAVHVLHLTLARVLHEFNLHTPMNSPVDMTEGVGITAVKATQLYVLITPRLPSSFYEYLNKY